MNKDGKIIASVLVTSMAVLGLLFLGVASAQMENHTRWNGNIEECVYFFDLGANKAGSCYVPEEHCTMDGRDKDVTVDTKECYYTPRKATATTAKPAATCKEFVEGDLIKLNYKGTDPDKNIGPAGKLLYTFGEPFNEDQEWQSQKGDAGTYNVKVTVSDGEYKDEATVCFKILPGNEAPVLSASDVTVDEGKTFTIAAKCTDPDEDKVTITYSGDMTSATWKTGYDDAGEYEVKIVCKDPDGLQDSETITVTVKDVNRAPVLTRMNDITVDETETVKLSPDCEDPEGGDVTVSFSGDMTSDTWKTTYGDAGDYKVTVKCTDEGKLSATETVLIKVLASNRPPMITASVIAG